MNVGDLIKRSGMTQTYVAEQLGLSRPHFNRVCNGYVELRPSQMVMLATILRLPLACVTAALIGGDKNDGETSPSRDEAAAAAEADARADEHAQSCCGA